MVGLSGEAGRSEDVLCGHVRIAGGNFAAKVNAQRPELTHSFIMRVSGLKGNGQCL